MRAAPASPGDGRSPADLLTERELQVLVLVARGLSNSQIAESRLNRISPRLGLENRVQAALLAHEAPADERGLSDGDNASWSAGTPA
jgi:DNA-binding NarL/FixJ family response regulator